MKENTYGTLGMWIYRISKFTIIHVMKYVHVNQIIRLLSIGLVIIVNGII